MTFNGNCSTQCGTPILDFHGTDDTLKSIDQFRQEWAIRNVCQTNLNLSYLSTNSYNSNME